MNSQMSILLATIYFLMQLLQPSNSARILGFFSTPSRSHLIIHESLMRELAVRGHDVTVVAAFEQISKPMKNYRYIELPIEVDPEFTKLQAQALKGAEKGESFLKMFPIFIRATTGRTSDILKSSTMEKLKSEKFDLVVFGLFVNDFQIGLASVFNCPSVIISVLPATKYTRDYVGSPGEISAVPNLYITAKNGMTFFQRVQNVLFTTMEVVIHEALDYFLMEPLYREHFPADKFPSYYEMKRNVSLVLVNQHFSQGTPQALVPALQEFSGMHIKRKPDPLPENLQQWLDGATDGAIIFSMGTNVKSSELSQEKRDAILSTFAKLKQKILWKFEDETLPNKPSNLLISKWLPQDDVLAHPNTVLFITHCGKGGMSEAKYHGVPILGIPIMADQPMNLDIAVAEGWAVGLQYSDLNATTFSKSVNEALSNSKYSQVVKEHSLKYRDRPQHPLDNAAFWVEYVIRHKGAKHLQSPGVHLNFIQYYSLDVAVLLFVIAYLSLKIGKLVLKFMFRKCFGKSKKSESLKSISKKTKKE